MWLYIKRLEHPVRVRRTSLTMAKNLITQFGGPDFTFYVQYSDLLIKPLKLCIYLGTIFWLSPDTFYRMTIHAEMQKK